MQPIARSLSASFLSGPSFSRHAPGTATTATADATAGARDSLTHDHGRVRFASQSIAQGDVEPMGQELSFRWDLDRGHREDPPSPFGACMSLSHALLDGGVLHRSSGALFVSLDLEVLQSTVADALCAPLFVIQLPGSMPVDPATTRRLAQLHARGYRFALADLGGMEDPRWAWAPFATYAKLPVSQQPSSSWAGWLARADCAGMQVIADGLEEPHEYLRLRRLGVQFFQGALIHPVQEESVRALPCCDLQVLHKLNRLVEQGASRDTLAMVGATDPALVIRLLMLQRIYVGGADAGSGGHRAVTFGGVPGQMGAHRASHPALHPAAHSTLHVMTPLGGHPTTHATLHPSLQSSASSSTHSPVQSPDHPAIHPTAHLSAHSNAHPSAHLKAHPNAHPNAHSNAHAGHPNGHTNGHSNAHAAVVPAGHVAAHPAVHPPVSPVVRPSAQWPAFLPATTPMSAGSMLRTSPNPSGWPSLTLAEVLESLPYRVLAGWIRILRYSSFDPDESGRAWSNSVREQMYNFRARLIGARMCATPQELEARVFSLYRRLCSRETWSFPPESSAARVGQELSDDSRSAPTS